MTEIPYCLSELPLALRTNRREWDRYDFQQLNSVKQTAAQKHARIPCTAFLTLWHPAEASENNKAQLHTNNPINLANMQAHPHSKPHFSHVAQPSGEIQFTCSDSRVLAASF